MQADALVALDEEFARSVDGIVATPSYVIGGAALIGYPGPQTLARVVANSRECGTISC